LSLLTSIVDLASSSSSIGRFQLMDEPFSVENGLLTQTLRMKRNVVSDRYAATIATMYQYDRIAVVGWSNAQPNTINHI
jgi:long-subunit acyl-CoA synthetase (AMP-forming)